MPHSFEPGLVSVVMIFRDAAEFFDEAIESVLSQTYPSLELLLCDDGSTDSSTATARRRAAEEPSRVRYLEHADHAHRGTGGTRNLGIGGARGEFVAFLDADDVWLDDHLSHEVSLLTAHPEVGVVCGQAVDWHSWADSEADDSRSPLSWPPGSVVPPPLMQNAVLRRGAFRTPTCSLLVRRAALASVGGADDQFRDMFEDQALLAKLYLTQSCVISGSFTARYRRHPRSASARAVRDGSYHPGLPNVSHERYLRWLLNLVPDRQGDDYEELRDLLNQALAAYDERGAGLREGALTLLRTKLPAPARRVVRGGIRRLRDLGPVQLGSLRRTTPLSRQFGYDRGEPIDRYYVEKFLAENAHLIRGRVLEVGDSSYTRRFGRHRLSSVDVLNIEPGHAETTIVADLADAREIPSDRFDCVVLTQTLHLIYDLQAAVRTLRRILAPGGTVLATFPGISPISADRWARTWYWALTPLAAARLFGEAFDTADVEVRAHGNVLTSVAFLEGMAAGELRRRELDTVDEQFPMLVTTRAFRPDSGVGGDRGRTDQP